MRACVYIHTGHHAILLRASLVVSHSQTSFFPLYQGGKKGSGIPPIEKPVLASIATRGG